MTIICGNALTELQKLAADSIDLLCTDPPYGYSFMNKDWDKAVVSVDIWKQCHRVLRAGAFAFVMSSPRQDVLSRMICNLQDAGFETNFTSIYWTYSSGFPKAADVSKLVDKRFNGKREIVGFHRKDRSIGKGQSLEWSEREKTKGQDVYITKPATPQAQKLEGAYCGFQPKPAVEVVLVVCKPLSEKTYVDQALANGKGITWLDDCRIPFQSEDEIGDVNRFIGTKIMPPEEGWNNNCMDKTKPWNVNQKGRFPANLLVSDDVLNDGKITGGTTHFKNGKGFGNSHIFGNGKSQGFISYEDKGSYSRYFDLDKWFDTTFPFIITPKASKSEKNMGLDKWMSQQVNDGRQTPIDNPFQRGETPRVCTHPTVKPLKLMSWLITLGSRPNDTVLDPFCGSGTTCIAAKMLNRKYIGIELNREYADIANARLLAKLENAQTPFAKLF